MPAARWFNSMGNTQHAILLESQGKMGIRTYIIVTNWGIFQAV
jgi:hypothetical protein